MINISPVLEEFDIRKLDRLDKKSTAFGGISGMPLYMLSIGHESGFPDQALKREDIGTPRDQREADVGLSFPLNAHGVPWIERYLACMASPLRGEGTVERALAELGAHGTRELRLYTAGVVFGQCVAQELDMQWIESPFDPGRPCLVSADVKQYWRTFDPWHAVREFAQLGEQASLAVHLNVLRNQAANEALMVSVNDWVQATFDRNILDRMHTEQRWHSPEGELEAIILLDVDEQELRRIEFDRVDGRVGFKEVMPPVA